MPLLTLGVVLALAAGSFHLVLLLLHLGGGSDNTYLDLLFFVALPAAFFCGLVMIWLGLRSALRKRRKKYEEKEETPPPIFPLPFSVVLVVGLLGLAVLGFSGFSGYAAYHYSESVGFCGSACHTPMGPTNTTYQHSIHRELACVECHVGDGARGFVEAKVAGTVQLLETVQDSFDRPIIAPRKKLNVPAQACTRCHNPEDSDHFRLEFRTAIASNEKNTFRPLFMALKTGGERELIQERKFHWHRGLIEYSSTDEKADEIPWVRFTSETGRKVFRADGLEAAAGAPGPIYEMQCIDCHNRVGHHYRPPDQIVNRLFSRGKLDYALPFLKRESARLLAERYSTLSEAQQAIAEGITTYYRENHPEISRSEASTIQRQVVVLQEAYSEDLFPEMRADWRAYPDHSGHWHSPGCFRCHDGQHVADDGSTIPNDCTLCHDFYQKSERDGAEALIVGQYKHPWDLDKVNHAQYPCSSCHQGGPTPPSGCVECHEALGLSTPK